MIERASHQTRDRNPPAHRAGGVGDHSLWLVREASPAIPAMPTFLSLSRKCSTGAKRRSASAPPSAAPYSGGRAGRQSAGIRRLAEHAQQRDLRGGKGRTLVWTHCLILPPSCSPRREDHHLATLVVDDESVSDEHIGFFCQQAIEKAIKSVLSRRGVRYRRTHDLAELIDLLTDHRIDHPQELETSVALTPFAAEMRYDYLPDEQGDEDLIRSRRRGCAGRNRDCMDAGFQADA